MLRFVDGWNNCSDTCQEVRSERTKEVRDLTLFFLEVEGTQWYRVTGNAHITHVCSMELHVCMM